MLCFRLAIRLIVQLVCAEDSLLLNEIFKNVSELLRMQNQTKDNVDITPVVIVLEDECDESVEIKAESKSMHKCPSPCKKLYTTARLFNDHYRK